MYAVKFVKTKAFISLHISDWL